MGGDRAPEAVIAGAEMVRARHGNVGFIMVGDEARLAPLMKGYPELSRVCELRHCDAVVGPDERPSAALRNRRPTSMRVAIQAVRDGEAAGIVSAGNTGALMALAKMTLRMLAGIHRPAIASIFPTRRGRTVMLDLGANLECTPDNLVQFAVMGEVFARTVLDIEKPSVGLLNVGIEHNKGNETVREAARLLQSGSLPIEFHGFVEGNDIVAGTVDVVVTDGFTGNVALKTAEGTARLFVDFLREAIDQSLMARIGYLLARGALKNFRDRIDPRLYNGGVFLGLNGITIKSHGSADEVGFANALGFAVEMARHGFNDKVIEELNRWHDGRSTEAQVAAG